MSESASHYPQFKPALRETALLMIEGSYPITASKLRVLLKKESLDFGRGELFCEVAEVVNELINDDAVVCFTVSPKRDSGAPIVVFMPSGARILDANGLCDEPSNNDERPPQVRYLTVRAAVDLPDALTNEIDDINDNAEMTFVHNDILSSDVREVEERHSKGELYSAILVITVALFFRPECSERDIAEAVAQMDYNIAHPFIVDTEIEALRETL